MAAILAAPTCLHSAKLPRRLRLENGSIFRIFYPSVPKLNAPTLSERLLPWYDAHRRDLPWRPPLSSPPGTRPDAYHVLLSEFMLQQTQVSTVVPYFHAFVQAFPTLGQLATAPEQRVLRLWQGLGYYSRARNLHRAAQRVVADHGGLIPADVKSLRALPGVGPYTAGAIASIAHGTPTPAVDGNVARVVSRLNGWTGDPRLPKSLKRIWAFCHLAVPSHRPGDHNASMMELGATVCTPRSPNCPDCPLRHQCVAFRRYLQDRIPPPRQARARPLEARQTFCLEYGGRYLLEQRPDTGRWAGMWQFPTVEARADVRPRTAAGRIAPVAGQVRLLGSVDHTLTHRQYQFDAFAASLRQRPPDRPRRKLLTLKEIEEFPLARPQMKIADMLRQSTCGVPRPKAGHRSARR